MPQVGGPNSATAPSAMKQSPMSGTTRTEKAPPVTTPVPYSRSHVPGNADQRPARTSTPVSSAPTSSGGT